MLVVVPDIVILMYIHIVELVNFVGQIFNENQQNQVLQIFSFKVNFAI